MKGCREKEEGVQRAKKDSRQRNTAMRESKKDKGHQYMMLISPLRYGSSVHFL